MMRKRLSTRDCKNIIKEVVTIKTPIERMENNIKQIPQKDGSIPTMHVALGG